MKKNLLLLCLLSSLSYSTQSQTKELYFEEKKTGFQLGLGMGLNYGGLGLNGLYKINKNVGVFVGAGYNLITAGVDAGVKYSFEKEESTKRSVPFILAMYGYNAGLKVTGSSMYENAENIEISYGPTFGGGLDIKTKRNRNDYWSCALLVPIRSRQFTDRYNYYEDMGIKFNAPILPVTFSIGYHMKL